MPVLVGYVKFHSAEKRRRLKLELGNAFLRPSGYLFGMISLSHVLLEGGQILLASTIISFFCVAEDGLRQMKSIVTRNQNLELQLID